MNMQSYINRYHAVLSAGLLIAGIIIFYTVIVMPAVLMRSKFSEKMDNLQFQYLKYSQVGSRKDVIARQLQQLKQIKISTEGFLKENTPALAAAELQEYIKKLVESNDGSLMSTQVVKSETNGPFPNVTVKVQMRCGMDCLQPVIYQVETGSPVLLINNLYIQSRNIRSLRNDRQTGDLLEVRFDVAGFIYQSESP